MPPPAATPSLLGGSPASTYRLQVRRDFDLYAAAGACGYLASLGVDALYLSPLLPSTPESGHGYDVVGYNRIDPQRGGADGWAQLLAAARANKLAVVVDIVPNHTGIGIPRLNAAWWDVLKCGAQSRYARWFDVDFRQGRVKVPVLGDDFEPTQLVIAGDELRYFEHRFPLRTDAPVGVGESGSQAHDRQHYELITHRCADTELNYRRFFAVNSLAGLRVEDEKVFDATHRQIGRWLREDHIDGLRVDHPDGLADPLGYLTRLRELAGVNAWITVEKILGPGEELPPQWPVDGTTGYDALAEVTRLLVDSSAEPALTRAYQRLTGDQLSFTEHVRAGKRHVVETILRSEVSRLARLFPSTARAGDAIAALLIAFPVYRSYLPVGVEHLRAAAELARATRPDLTEAIEAVRVTLEDPTTEAAIRFQQTSGAVMAKGVEDTAYYRYSRFVALNEVGGNPAQLGGTVAEFHAAQLRRQAAAPRSMTTLATHDTKRSEDVRARLAVLSELPDDWTALAAHLMSVAPLPDARFAYLLWQTFVGTGNPPANRDGGFPTGGSVARRGVAGGGRFIDRGRMHAYAEKAMREAAVGTTWRDPDTASEAAVHAVVDRAYDDPTIYEPLATFIDRITPHGWTNSLSQKLIQLTMPGVPDVYQGTARWDDSLVDPDNRRTVDFTLAQATLAELDADSHPPTVDASGAAKLWVVSRALRLRRDRPELFVGYRALQAHGALAEHVVAFDRGGATTVATRLPVGVERCGGWGGTTLSIGGVVSDVLRGVTHRGEVSLADLLAEYPVALLVR